MILWYNFLTFLLIGFGLPFLVPALLLSGKRRSTFLPRLGLRGLPRSRNPKDGGGGEKRPLWIHALSVGETISAVPLVRGLRQSFADRGIVFSVSTRTGFGVANELLKEEVREVFYFPYDLAFSVRRVASRVDPSGVVLVESDIWPNFLWEMARREIPVLLVNARLSQRSFSGYKKFSYFMVPIFSLLEKICVQSEVDALRFKQLGVPSEKIQETGNLKMDQMGGISRPKELEDLRRSLGIDPEREIFLAGSTHQGEEKVIAEAFLRLERDFPRLLLMVVPRHPERSEAVSRFFRGAGFSVRIVKDPGSTRSFFHEEVLIVGFMGKLRTLYGIADLTFVGGSLVPAGGQNPLEPARLSKPILFGPNMSDFREVSRMLLEAGGAVEVHDAESMYRNGRRLLSEPDRAKEMGKKAFGVLQAHSGSLERTLGVIEQVFERSSERMEGKIRL